MDNQITQTPRVTGNVNALNPYNLYSYVKPTRFVSGDTPPINGVGEDKWIYTDTLTGIMYLNDYGTWNIYYDPAGAEAGVLGGQNLGTAGIGVPIFKQVADNIMEFRKIVPSENILLGYDHESVHIGVNSSRIPIGNLQDIDITGLNDGDFLQWNETSGQWEPVAGTSTINSASSVGVGGVAVLDGVAAGDIQIRTVDAGSNKVSVTEDLINKKVDINVNEANLDVNNMGGDPWTNTSGGVSSVVKQFEASKLAVLSGVGLKPYTFTPSDPFASGAASAVRIPDSIAPGGNVVLVSEDATQTLTNKTIDYNVNTISNLPTYENNTASNVGDPVGASVQDVFKQKVGVDLEFKRLKTLDNVLRILDLADDNVSMTINQANIDANNLDNIGDYWNNANVKTGTNKTLSDASNTIGANEIRTSGLSVTVDAAAPPVAGQVLQATSATNATWQTPVSDYWSDASVNTSSGVKTFPSAGLHIKTLFGAGDAVIKAGGSPAVDYDLVIPPPAGSINNVMTTNGNVTQTVSTITTFDQTAGGSLRVRDQTDSYNMTITSGSQTTNGGVSIPANIGGSTLDMVLNSNTQTITNKTLDNTNSVDIPALSIASEAQGDIIYRDATGFTRLVKGSDGQVLTSTASSVQWSNAATITKLSFSGRLKDIFNNNENELLGNDISSPSDGVPRCLSSNMTLNKITYQVCDSMATTISAGNMFIKVGVVTVNANKTSFVSSGTVFTLNSATNGTGTIYCGVASPSIAFNAGDSFIVQVTTDAAFTLSSGNSNADMGITCEFV